MAVARSCCGCTFARCSFLLAAANNRLALGAAGFCFTFCGVFLLSFFSLFAALSPLFHHPPTKCRTEDRRDGTQRDARHPRPRRDAHQHGCVWVLRLCLCARCTLCCATALVRETRFGMVPTCDVSYCTCLHTIQPTTPTPPTLAPTRRATRGRGGQRDHPQVWRLQRQDVSAHTHTHTRTHIFLVFFSLIFVRTSRRREDGLCVCVCTHMFPPPPPSPHPNQPISVREAMESVRGMRPLVRLQYKLNP
jgi:hypothetical protein